MLRAAVLALAAVVAFGCSNGIPYGRDSAMVPLNDPVQGCRGYRLVVDGGYSPGVVYFRRADGSFTKDRRQADCTSAAQ